MNDLGPGGLVRLSAMHVNDPGGTPARDAVWAGLVQRQSRTGEIGTDYRFVSLWGRRMQGVNMHRGKWTTFDNAVRKFDVECRSKLAEEPPYREVSWEDPYYGLADAIRELMPVSSLQRSPGNVDPTGTRRATPPAPKPVYEESPRLRLRRDKKLG